MQLVKSIHNGMAKQAYRRQNELKNNPGLSQESPLQSRDTLHQSVDPGGNMMFDRLTALQDAYWDIASALSEADGIDYSDPEELELIIATLLDMDAVDGASSATMLAECAKSPDVATRQALANALGNAPSLWALGNAGMGALQRLAEDVNPAVAAAASKALEELRKQWQMDVDGAKQAHIEHFSANDEKDEDAQEEEDDLKKDQGGPYGLGNESDKDDGENHPIAACLDHLGAKVAIYKDHKNVDHWTTNC
ncbi:hypothetical protein L7F22_037870 [Adiantum nelumboides]|nr:hypothetical protein [Adiantum nelumboides]